MTQYQSISEEEYQREEAQIYQELGRAIAEWSLVEEWLAVVYTRSVFSVTVGGGPLIASFNSVHSVQGKIQMIRAALENLFILNSPSIDTTSHILRAEKWSKGKGAIRKVLEKHNQNRNKLAHGALIVPGGIAAEKHYSLPVWAPFFSTISYEQSTLFKDVTPQPKPPETLTSNDIREFRKGFIRVQHLLANFAASFS